MAVGDLVTEDYGFEYRGFAFGGSTSDFLVAPGMTGFADLPGVAVADRQRLRRHGLHPGDDFMLGRQLVVPIEVTATDTTTWETNLSSLREAFRVDPSCIGEDPLVFQIPGIAGGGKRRINCRPRGLIVPIDLDWFYEIPVVTVRFDATSPYILDDTETIVVSSLLTAGSSGLTWPLTWPLNWGTVETASFTVTNSGTQPAEFCATIPGPVTNPKLVHVGSGSELEFGITLSAGEFLEVDTDARTVLLNGTASRYSTITAGSTWFHLDPGSNELSYRADSGTSNLTITFRSTWS